MVMGKQEGKLWKKFNMGKIRERKKRKKKNNDCFLLRMEQFELKIKMLIFIIWWGDFILMMV